MRTGTRPAACGIADRVICAEVDWIETDVLDSYRCYRGAESTEEFLEWKKVGTRAKAKNLKAHGHFRGRPGVADARSARLALWLLHAADHPPRAALLIRDSDARPERRIGLEQARQADRGPCRIVIGLAHAKRECWVLAGFDPQTEKEAHKLNEVRKDLGFDPRTRAHELTAQKDSAKRNAKRVLRQLLGKNRAREAACWEDASIETLEKRGRRTGLTDYIAELNERLIPLLARSE